MIRIAGVIIIFCILIACSGNFSLQVEEKEQPQVLTVEPADGAVIESVEIVTVFLSKGIDPETVNEESFLIVPAESLSTLVLESKEILSAIDDNEIISLQGEYSFSSDSTEISWIPSENFNPQTAYQIILTSGIQTKDYYPLNQTPGEETTFFISSFTIKGGADAGEGSLSISPAPEILMINEILYDSTESDSDGNVFIELFGTAGAAISGYSVRLINGANGQKTDEIVFSEGTTIPDDGFFVLADSKTGSSTESNIENVDYVENFDPQNGPDSIQLISPSGQLVDTVGYGEGMVATNGEGLALYEGGAAEDPAGGLSLSRTNMGDTDNNAEDFVINESPSPGSGEVAGEDLNIIENGEETEGDINQTNIDNLHFTEVVTDPQQDWNDSSGGNGVEFDSVPGDGTVGSSDEWIEIQNGREETVDLTGWRLEMNDGTDATESFDSSSAFFVFSDGGDLTNFQSDEFLVIGNPAGVLNNSITLELYDPADELIDSLEIDDANATGLEDEAFSINENLEWDMGEATIGF